MFLRPHELKKLPPFTLNACYDFRGLTRAQAKQRHEELVAILPDRIATIEEVLANDGIRDQGNARVYMDQVGEWLAEKARFTDVRNLPPDPERGKGGGKDLDEATANACRYIAYLFASRLIQACGQLSIELCVDSKRNALYHQSIIRSLDEGTELEPVRVVMNFARPPIERGHPKQTLGQFWEHWLSHLRDGLSL